jgi:glucokinase
MKRAVFVNGIPASGKSTVARMISDEMRWPLLTLDTIKESFFAHLGTGDRDYNRLLGKASYQAIFAIIKDFPPEATVVIDAWFGFQPAEVLKGHIATSGIKQAVEIWCHAPGPVLGERYHARLSKRSTGHLGESYIPELIALASTAKPLGTFPRLELDTTQVLDKDSLTAWLNKNLA